MIPIRTRLTVLRDGSTSSSSSVFCERRGCSVRPGSCVRCGAEVANDGDGRASVACPWSSTPPTSVQSDPWGLTKLRPAGLALTRRVVCIMDDAPLAAASTALAAAPGFMGVPVVDRHHRLVGMLARGAATLALLGPSRISVVRDHVTPAAPSISESDSLGEAFRRMNARHLRELIVVNHGREIVGVLRDIDALQVVAAARRACA